MIAEVQARTPANSEEAADDPGAYGTDSRQIAQIKLYILADIGTLTGCEVLTIGVGPA
jgi:hypothetical protein